MLSIGWVYRRWCFEQQRHSVACDVRVLVSQVQSWRTLPHEVVVSGVEPHCGKTSGWAEGTWRERERERESSIENVFVTTYLEL